MNFSGISFILLTFLEMRGLDMRVSEGSMNALKLKGSE